MKTVSGKKKFLLCMVACMIFGLGLAGCSNGKSDNTAPTGTSSLSTTSATKSSVTITVNATDTGSGVASITLPNSTVVTASTATYTVSANGTYDFILTDKDGNASILPVTVSNIYTAAPTASSSLSTTSATSGAVIITVTASDVAGVASITLPNSTVVTASTATYTVSANGTYSFTITDEAGNTSILPVTVSNIITSVSADNDIQAVTTIGFVDIDGPKVKAIVVKYNHTLIEGSVGLDSYNAYSYANLPITYEDGAANGGTVTAAEGGTEDLYPSFERATGTPGAITYAYVRSTPTIDTNHVGDASGNYVILELNTNYMLASAIADWRSGVAGGVEQIVPIVASNNVVISAGTGVKSNYADAYYYDKAPMGNAPDEVDHSYWGKLAFDDTLYTLSDIAGYKLYTSNRTASYQTTYTDQVTGGTVTATIPNQTVFSMVAGPSFTGSNCFSEYDGNYYNPSMMYSIFVPSGYTTSKKYMMVLHIPDAGGLGDDPVTALTESQAPANYASARVQALATEQGYDGLIVVVPEILKSQQDVDNGDDANQFVPATWQLVDSILQAYPNIDRTRIYGSGQSMGGMQLLDMASQRSDFFAGLWVRGSQWGNNYNKTYTAPFDGTIITNPDWQNWYYSVSDMNILATNMTGDSSSWGGWSTISSLYNQFAGVTIPYVVWDPTITSQATANANLDALVATSNSLGMYWDALSGGSHKLTWMYADTITDSYNWLLTQTQESELERGKLASLAGLYSQNAGTDGYNTSCGGGGFGSVGAPCPATAALAASSTSVTVAAGSSVSDLLTINTATSATQSISYSLSIVDGSNNDASSDVTVTYKRSDGTYDSFANLAASNINTVTNGKALTLSIEGVSAGTYTATFTATFGSTTVTAPVAVTVTN